MRRRIAPGAPAANVVTKDNAASGDVAGATSKDISLTVGTLTNGAVICAAHTYSSEPYTCTVTVGGSSATFVDSTKRDPGSIWVFKFMAPTSGAKTIHFAFNQSVQGSVGAVSLSNVNQTTPIVNVVKLVAESGNPASQVVTSATNHMAMQMVGVLYGETFTDNQTRAWYNANTDGESAVCQTAAGAASVTMTETKSDATHPHIAIAFDIQNQ